MNADMRKRANGVRWETVSTYAGIPYRLCLILWFAVQAAGWMCWKKCTTGKWFGNDDSAEPSV